MAKYKSRRKQKKTKKSIKRRKYKGGDENIYGFHHICFKNNGQQIFEEQLQKIKDSGLYDRSNKIFCSLLGQRNNYVLPDKYEIIYENEKMDVYERPILRYMYDNSSINEGKYWYIHTKGIRHYQTPNENHVRDWRNYMEYFIITKWQQCVNDLNSYDVVGVSLQREPKIHYSGNFWWSKSSYVKTNEPEFKKDDSINNIKNSKYYDTEMWICNGKQRPAKFLSYHNTSGLDLYNNEYPPEKYVEPAVLNRTEIILEADNISGGKRKTIKVKKQRGGNRSVAYVINLDSNTERWERIQKDFQNSSISLMRVSAIKEENGHLGCGKSFQKIVAMAKDENTKNPDTFKTVLIFEDDNMPLKDFDNRWKITKQWLDSNMDSWDIFNGGILFNNEKEFTATLKTTLDSNVKLFIPNYFYAANWIYINSSAYDKVLAWDLNVNKEIDRYFSNFYENKFKTLCIYPFLCETHNGLSNINKIEKNLTRWYNDVNNKFKEILNSQNISSGGRTPQTFRKKKNNKYTYKSKKKKIQGGNMSKAYVINVDTNPER